MAESDRRRHAGLRCFAVWLLLCGLFGLHLFFSGGEEGVAAPAAHSAASVPVPSTPLYDAATTSGKAPPAFVAPAPPPAPPPSACPPPPAPPPPGSAAPPWPAPWPANAVLRSTCGAPYRHLSLDALWAWSPERATIVSGDSFRDRCPFVCDDDYGVGKPRGCRFSAEQLTDGARVFAKLPHHFPPARALLQQAGVRHVFVNGGGDTPLEGAEIQVRARTRARGA